MATILIIEDEPAIAESLSFALRRDGFSVHTASCLADSHCLLNNADIILLDLMLPDGSGFDLIVDIRRKSHRLTYALAWWDMFRSSRRRSSCDASRQRERATGKCDSGTQASRRSGSSPCRISWTPSRRPATRPHLQRAQAISNRPPWTCDAHQKGLMT